VFTAADVTSVDRADALVRDGCYRCLNQAAELYARVLDRHALGSSARVLRALYDATLLLAVRQKEVGVDADATLARARVLLSRLRGSTNSQTSGSDHLETLLKAAEAVVGDLSGLDSETRAERENSVDSSPVNDATTARLYDELQRLAATDLVAAYFLQALDCETPRNRPPARVRPDPPPALAELPLMRYRVAICSSGQPVALTRLREENPGWIETLYFEGKYEMGSPARPADPARAAPMLTGVAEMFPESVAIHAMLARAQEMNGEFEQALDSLDHVLVLKPSHVDARLGRVRNLSFLSRADEAVTAATVLIEAGTWHVGEAYYWRAWNQYIAQRMAPAWLDVQEALRLLANTSVSALAGSIAYARKDLDAAVHHFDDALQMDPTNCAAASSAGLVHVDRGAWLLAAEKYSAATGCFALIAKTARTDLARLEQSALEPSVKPARLSTARKRLESAEELGARAALSAASAYLHAGQVSLALTYMELAERHPATRIEARALRTQTGKIQ
jgi:tetratricopeptide (TPR) repeat protein